MFTDFSIREYFDTALKLKIDRDINTSINLKRVWLDLFPTIKRRKNKVVVAKSNTTYIYKEVMTVFKGIRSPH